MMNRYGLSLGGVVLILVAVASAVAQETITDKTAAVVSPIPKFTFPATLDGQLKALQDNPLLAHFAEARASSAGNPHKAIYHFVQPEGYLNDPNGLSFWRGNWHLFYQWVPPDTDNQLHWGHAYSDDLVHWKDLPPAIYPGPEQGSWSGSVYLEEDRAIAAYKISFGTALTAALINAVFGMVIAWVLVRYPFPGKRIFGGRYQKHGCTGLELCPCTAEYETLFQPWPGH